MTLSTVVVLGFMGCVGATIMFISDLILYYPSKQQHRSAASYFSKIDPGGDNLGESTMQEISISRVMCGGAMGAVSSVFYILGFASLSFGLQDTAIEQGEKGSVDDVIPLLSSVGFSLMMAIGSVYHGLFVYTSFLSKEIAKHKDCPTTLQSLHHLVSLHRTYLRYVYKWAVLPGLMGTLSFVWCILTRDTYYASYTLLFVPALSAPLKKILKSKSCGGLVLCGGLTNLWNLGFFLVLTYSAYNYENTTTTTTTI